MMTRSFAPKILSAACHFLNVLMGRNCEDIFATQSSTFANGDLRFKSIITDIVDITYNAKDTNRNAVYSVYKDTLIITI